MEASWAASSVVARERWGVEILQGCHWEYPKHGLDREPVRFMYLDGVSLEVDPRLRDELVHLCEVTQTDVVPGCYPWIGKCLVFGMDVAF